MKKTIILLTLLTISPFIRSEDSREKCLRLLEPLFLVLLNIEIENTKDDPEYEAAKAHLLEDLHKEGAHKDIAKEVCNATNNRTDNFEALQLVGLKAMVNAFEKHNARRKAQRSSS